MKYNKYTSIYRILKTKLKKTIKNLKFLSVKILLTSKNYSLNNSLIIAGEARGGTTWLMELLQNIPNTVVNWEPLHVNKGVVPKKFMWSWRPYINKTATIKEYEVFFNKLLTFSIYSTWTIQFVKPEKILNSKIVITKFVRANRLLSWIVNNITLRTKPILLIRHPIPTALSQLKAFKKQTINEEKKLLQNWLLENGLKVSTPVEVKVAKWLKNNIDTINDPDVLNNCIIVFYEELIIDPNKTMRRILSQLMIQNIEEVISDMKFRKASRTDFNNEFDNNPIFQLEKYLNEISESEKYNIQNMFNSLSFKLYTVDSPIPQNVLLQ